MNSRPQASRQPTPTRNCHKCSCRPQVDADDQDIPERKFGEVCSLHGIQELYAARTIPLRIFWLVAFSLALSAAVYGCYAILHEYLESPVVVSYFVREPKTNSIPLPDVIVCPFNRFNSSFLAEHNVSQDLADFIQITYGFGVPYQFKSALERRLWQNETFMALSAEFDSLLDRLQLTFTNFTLAASVSCRAVIPYCVVNGQIYDCCATAEYLTTGAGRCYRVKGIDQEAAGYGYGITVVIRLNDSLLSPAYNNLHNDGVAIKLAERLKGPDFDLTFIPRSSHALMSLRANIYEFINSPPRYTCKEDNLTSYSRESCINNCLFGLPEEICNCSHAANMYPKRSLCSTVQFATCFLPAAMKVFQEGNNLQQQCAKNCTPACSYWQFTTALSYAGFPSKTLHTYVQNEEEWKQFQSEIILDVFYEKLEFTMIKQYPRMTADTFISNLGGQIGLWVGGSILTLLQLAVFGCRNLCRIFSSSKRPKADGSNCQADLNGNAIAPQLTAYRPNGFRPSDASETLLVSLV